MPRRRTRAASPEEVQDFRHGQARRRNNPPAGIAPTYEVRERQTTPYQYDPHLDPQLVWAGKAEHTSFEVDVVSLHIHERISTRAILDAVRRPQPLQLSIFGETPLSADQQVEFYQHEVGWANRLILGDSLLVMNSLLVKEGMAGKVQMIYIDPPYGIKYASNFQPRIDRRDVKDKDEDLTHEPEQIKAYRDTWKLGIHSYLTYLRDRFLLARELLTESGSLFVQINDENLHLVRCLLDEVFGRENFVAVIAFAKASAQASVLLPRTSDYLLWYAKSRSDLKYRQVYLQQVNGDTDPPTGDLTSQGYRSETTVSFVFEGREFHPGASRHWKTTTEGLRRLAGAERLVASRDVLRYRRLAGDFGLVPVTHVWSDTMQFGVERVFVVQTAEKVVERCLLMTTDPGDLVLDPTCVRKGTGVWVGAPTPALPAGGEGAIPPPSTGEERRGVSPPSTGEERRGVSPPSTGEERRGAPPPSAGEVRRGAIPIEQLHPGDWVLGHDGKPHRVLRVIRRPYRGVMVGIRHALSPKTLWLTADHRVLCKPRPRTLGGQRDWSASPLSHRERRQQLRRDPSPAERRLWSALRRQQLGVKFRRQHPIGPYIADFYSREAHLVVEVDGSTHAEPEAREYDAARDAYMRSLGLDVLRFTAQEVEQELEGVCLAIQNQCRLRTESVEGAQWVQAAALQPGDLVFFGPARQAVPIESVETAYAEEEVYDLEVEGAHSFLTEVCAVHNCGSGTTAYCAEKWGRRWITCDTSRVALAIARQRLMTAKFDYYELRDPERGPAGGFFYETVPHITLESIAKNAEIDVIAAKYQAQIEQALAGLNAALAERGAVPFQEWEVPREVPHPLWPQEAQETYGRLLQAKQQAVAADASEVQPLLEEMYRLTGHRWGNLGDVPDPVPALDWPEEAKEALRRFWEAKRQKRREIDESIQRNAPQETLYDRPKVRRGVVRVSGPFTVEAIPVPAVEDPTQIPIPQFEDTLPVHGEGRGGGSLPVHGEGRGGGSLPVDGGQPPLLTSPVDGGGTAPFPSTGRVGEGGRVSDRGGDYLTTMLNLLREQGSVLFPGGKRMDLRNLRALNVGYLHAQAETQQNGETLRVAISFGPQHGPVTAFQVQEAIPTARMNGYPILIFAGFSFDPEAQALIQKVPVTGIQVHFANIAPDVLVGDLLKTTRASQIFTVFGQPDVAVQRQRDGTFTVELRGVDIYDPLTGETEHTRGSDVAAWFLDTDYDGMTFHICQAFFPGDPDAWEKLQRALRAWIDPEAFERMRGTVSFPFMPGEHRRIAVKVIDFRGNEVVKVMGLG